MESLLIIAGQFLTEVVGSALVSIPFNFGPKTATDQRQSQTTFWYFFFLIVGGMVGWLSVQLVPQSLLTISWLRIANIFVAPLIAGSITWWIATIRTKSNLMVVPRQHFWRAFWFTVAFAFIRFIYAGR